MKYPLSLFIIVLLAACSKPNRNVTPAFYYWKAAIDISEPERQVMRELGVKKIYLRLFDVDWSDERNMPIPVSELQFKDSLPQGIEVIPVIYITNKTMLKTSGASIPELGTKIAQKISRMCADHGIVVKEIQTDCDWTDNTQLKYFNLIKAIKQEYAGRPVSFSSTIRLHQVKYYKRTGIPPVDKGILMFYNIGQVEDKKAENSIYNKEDAAKYISHLKDYPLQLDVALPAYTWAVHFNGDKVMALINNVNHADLKNNGNFMFSSGNTYTATSSFFYKGSYFKQGDELRVEEINPDACLQAAQQLEKELNHNDITLSFYHLDPKNTLVYGSTGYKKVVEVF